MNSHFPPRRLRAPLTAAAVILLTGGLSTLSAAVIAQLYEPRLALNNKKLTDGNGPGFIIDGTLYRFNWQVVPYAFDFDGNGTVDLTIASTGRDLATTVMFVTQHGRNQVWSYAGGVAGNDFGSHAIALLSGTSVGPSLFSDIPRVGWHNEDDSRGHSTLVETRGTTPVSGDFFPETLFQEKYLGFRFAAEDGMHYGWMALTGFRLDGQEIYVTAWAYESAPDTAIPAGQIPEPAAPALAALTLLAAFRRRREVSWRPCSAPRTAGSKDYNMRGTPGGPEPGKKQWETMDVIAQSVKGS